MRDLPSCLSIAGASSPRRPAPIEPQWDDSPGEALGANVETMSPEHHDLVLAITSHVPHLIAYTIVGTADNLQTVTRSEVIKFRPVGSGTLPDCRLRPDHVARRIFVQPRRRAGDAGAL